MTKEPPATAPAETTAEDVLASFDDLRSRIDGFHMPYFLGIDVTMSQAKILLLLVSKRAVNMSELAARLGVSLSTVSGHVDRLVEQGLVSRRDDPGDRRQVLIAPTPAALDLAERFHQFNATQLRRLLELMTPAERLDVARAFGHLCRAMDRITAMPPAMPPVPTPPPRKG